MALLEDQRFMAANNAQLLGCPLAEYWSEQQPGGACTLLADCVAQAYAQGHCRLEPLKPRSAPPPTALCRSYSTT